MKAARALAVLSLILVPLVATAADPGVAAAQQKLETARGNLTKAVQRIEKDPPETADLDAAHAAVEALKDAIDAGADLEQKDLDFAKAVLAARKELRTQREYVDQRRANVDLFNQRRAIDAALATLNDRAHGTEGKEAVSKNFDEARAAADALKKAIEEARPLIKKDSKFATYLAGAEATLAVQRKAIDERWTLQSVDKHRALVEQSRTALAAAMNPLSTTSSDEQFQTADHAASNLAKILEAGKVLEANDKSYRKDAEGVRKDLAQAKKQMDALWSETGLARLKAEIEPAKKDLGAAAKAVRSKKTTGDQLAEARTAAIVVRKLLEKYQAEASRSPAVGQYLTELKNTLVEVEGELERRKLETARSDVTQALKTIGGKNPTDEQFQEASSALVVLEKTLQTVHAKEPAMVQPAADATAQIRDARASIATRRLEVDVLRQRAKVEDARKQSADLMREASQANAGSDRMAEAETGIKLIRAALDEGAELVGKDREYAAYDREVKERVTELNAKLASRKIVLAATEGRTLLNDTTSAAKAGLEAAKKPDATDPDLAAATKSLEALGKAIDGNVALEKQDNGYAAQAAKARDNQQRLTEGLDFAKQARELRRQTVEALAAGASTAEAAAAGKTLRAQKEQGEKALAQFKGCESGGAMLLRDNTRLESVPLFIEGRRTPAKDVIALCVQRAEATEKLLAEVKPLIAFDEGPKRSFETGKSLLAQKKDGEALHQFDECISSGSILQNRNPELKERKFQVAGAETSLPELIQQCAGQRKTLKAKK